MMHKLNWRWLPFILILLMSSTNVSGQVTFKNDHHYKYRSDSLLQTVGIGHPDFKTAEFELRYWIKDVSYRYANELFIVRHLKDRSWTLTHYQVCFNFDENTSRKSYSIVSRRDSLLNGWDSQWDELVSFNILNLPDEKLVRKNWKTEDGGLIFVADGTYFSIELLTQNRQRTYGYENPETFLKSYGPKYTELVNINKIITALNAQLNFNASKRYKCLP